MVYNNLPKRVLYKYRLVKPANYISAFIWRNNNRRGSIKRWVNKWINTAKISLTIAN
jgi:hypothetical protein